MLKLKRIFSIALATLLLFAATPFVVAAQAEDGTTGLYILSKQCPKEYGKESDLLVVCVSMQ